MKYFETWLLAIIAVIVCCAFIKEVADSEVTINPKPPLAYCVESSGVEYPLRSGYSTEETRAFSACMYRFVNILPQD